MLACGNLERSGAWDLVRREVYIEDELHSDRAVSVPPRVGPVRDFDWSMAPSTLRA